MQVLRLHPLPRTPLRMTPCLLLPILGTALDVRGKKRVAVLFFPLLPTPYSLLPVSLEEH
jgi:hypothetical protein